MALLVEQAWWRGDVLSAAPGWFRGRNPPVIAVRLRNHSSLFRPVMENGLRRDFSLQTSCADGESRAHVCKRRAQTGKAARTSANVVRRRGKPCARLQMSYADGESRAHVCKCRAQTGKAVRTSANVVRRRGKPCA